MESIPDLPDRTDVEPVVTTRFDNRIGDFDQNKRTLSQFLWLGKRVISELAPPYQGPQGIAFERCMQHTRRLPP